MLLQNHALPRFTDAQGRFQFAYVKDAAQAILASLGNARAYGQAYNVCGEEIITYGSFFETLRKAAQPEDLEGLVEVPLTVEHAASQGVPMPFPVMAEETHLCDNAKGKAELGIVYAGYEADIQGVSECVSDMNPKVLPLLIQEGLFEISGGRLTNGKG
jgi:nucleoside-diphosphate-sugar epimerase